MNTDIRLSVGFFDNPKIVKLQRRLGDVGIIALQRLWLWAAQYQPDGTLYDMDPEDIEIAAKWGGEHGKFFDCLLSLCLIEGEEGEYYLHDWAENNPWVASSEGRSNKGRLNRMKSSHPAIYDILVKGGMTSISKEQYSLIVSSKNPSSEAKGILKQEVSTTQVDLSITPSPSPAPTPAPSPTPKAEETKERASAFNTFWAEYPKKVSKGDAEKAWKKIKSPSSTVLEILSALAWQKKSEQWQKGFIPNPATYLNGRRWEDEPIEDSPRPSNSRQQVRLEDGLVW